jgi:hypothetical protein
MRSTRPTGSKMTQSGALPTDKLQISEPRLVTIKRSKWHYRKPPR